LLIGNPADALAVGKTALMAHDKVLGREHAWTKDSARVTVDALDAFGRDWWSCADLSSIPPSWALAAA
jgi:hypothetical protein